MNATIITAEPAYGKFMQKGFQHENITATVVSFKDFEDFLNSMNSDIFLFYISDPREDYKFFIDKLKNVRQDCLIVLLTDSSLSQLKYPWTKQDFDLIFYKPYSFLAIAFEIKFNICSLREKNVEKEIRGGDIMLDLRRREAFFRDKKLPLRNKEFELLQYLIMNAGKTLTRPEILERVWDYNANILTNTIDVHISRIRSKLKKFNAGDFIKTVPCIGYIYDGNL